jgi:hypothetical protein
LADPTLSLDHSRLNTAEPGEQKDNYRRLDWKKSHVAAVGLSRSPIPLAESTSQDLSPHCDHDEAPDSKTEVTLPTGFPIKIDPTARK